MLSQLTEEGGIAFLLGYIENIIIINYILMGFCTVEQTAVVDLKLDVDV